MAKPGKKRAKKTDPASKKRITKNERARDRSLNGAGVPQIPAPAGAESTELARINQLEADRTNLMAQVAWAKGIAQEQQKALEAERERTTKLEAELAEQRLRVEQLKSLSAWDRFLGRHKQV